MKILGGIPTRLRSTSGRIADTLAEVCGKVVVVSQHAECHHQSGRVEVIEKPENYGLVASRNYIAKYAIDNNYDFIVQSDDDLSFEYYIIEQLIQELIDNPTLGAIASSSRAYFNWDKTTYCTKNFLLHPCCPQLWAARTSVIKEIGPWTTEYLEDREHGLRMWRAGYAIGILHINIDWTHNPFIARVNTSAGGQAKGNDRYEKLGKAIISVNIKYPDLVSIVQAPQNGKRTFTTRYNWWNMLKYVENRFGKCLEYEDSKGRYL